jgi:transposase
MHRIGEEASEALDRVRAPLRVLRTIRPKYACRACEGPIVQAKAPARLVEGGMAAPALVAHIAAAKYAWQSTLYRQAQILAGWGVAVDRQTLARWMRSAAWMATAGQSSDEGRLPQAGSAGRLAQRDLWLLSPATLRQIGAELRHAGARRRSRAKAQRSRRV